MITSVKWYKRLIALLVSLLLLAAFLPGTAFAAEKEADEDEPENPFDPLVFSDSGTPPTEVDAAFGSISPNLRLEAYPVYVGHIGKLEQWKFTLYGTENMLSQMKDALTEKEAPFAFRYVLDILGEQDFALTGNISYGEKKGDSFASVTRFNTVLTVGDYRYIDNLHSKCSDENQLSWLVEMPTSAHFDINKVTGYRLRVYNAAKRLQRLTYEFEPALQTVTALYTPMRRGSSLKIDMPDEKHMTLTILDPRIPDGYTNSPEKKGDIKPYWHIKIVLSALEWFEIILDGTYGEPMDAMKFYCGHYVREEDDSNKYSPKSSVIETVADCAYAIDGDRITFSLQYPNDRPVDFTYIDYITVDMSNGRSFRVNQYPMF